jgi:hypothetical protein
MALRKRYENVRFADHTNDPTPSQMRGRKAGMLLIPAPAQPLCLHVPSRPNTPRELPSRLSHIGRRC